MAFNLSENWKKYVWGFVILAIIGLFIWFLIHYNNKYRAVEGTIVERLSGLTKVRGSCKKRKKNSSGHKKCVKYHDDYDQQVKFKYIVDGKEYIKEGVIRYESKDEADDTNHICVVIQKKNHGSVSKIEPRSAHGGCSKW